VRNVRSLRSIQTFKELDQVRADEIILDARPSQRHTSEISSMLEVDQDAADLKEFEGDYEEYLFELGELSHKPIHGPRVDNVGENVYAFEWETLNVSVRRKNDPPNVLLGSILYDMQRRITQRHASVAASFITWLGTNCGQSIILKADALRRLGNSEMYGSQAFVAAWAIENTRRNSINSGIRYIESILAPADHFGQDLFSKMWGLRRMPNISIEDHETIEHIVAWLATDRAGEFIRRCDHLIKVRQRYDSPMDTVRLLSGVK
jgi:hypothetical protein